MELNLVTHIIIIFIVLFFLADWNQVWGWGFELIVISILFVLKLQLNSVLGFFFVNCLVST